MKKIFTLIIFFSVPVICNAQNTIHVYSIEVPWENETINKEEDKIYSINQAINAAEAGDNIIIHEGIYREKVIVNKNNLKIQNYERDYVLVTGSEIISAWSEATGMTTGIMEADISGFDIETEYTQFFANGQSQMMARHPNNTTGKMMEPMDVQSGYALLSNVHKDEGENATGHATLEGTNLPDVDLIGGIFRGLTGKMRNYVYGKITSLSGNTVSFKAINNGVWKNSAAISTNRHKFSWGFVLHKNLIDYPGEWFVDQNKLYYLPESETPMESTRFEIQVRERVLVTNNTSGLTLKGIHFVAGNVDMQNTSNATIEACSFRYLHPFWTPTGYGQGATDRKGVYLSNSSNNLFKDTYVAHSWGNMFALKDGNNNRFENCIIKDFGWVGVFTSAIHVNKSDNTNISKCTFGDAGRFQIRIDGGDAQVNIMDCDFYGAMKIGEDAGPIEATSTGRIGSLDLKGSVIAYNKIHDVHGVPVSDGNYNKVKATAFYMEDTENYTAHHNLIYNIRGDKYTGPHDINRTGEFLYMGPRYNPMHMPINYYNNTIWNVDANISIWNIEIDNWKELGLTPPDTSGFMADGHFVNNIFMDGPKYKISYVRQIISSTGSNKGYIKLDPSPSLETKDFQDYTNHCANLNYHFNPLTNVMYESAEAASNFIDAQNGNFSLKDNSNAKASGTEIDGITSSANPDCGALEGSNRVLNAGATITQPLFMEEGVNLVPVTNFPSEKTVRLEVYPNPTSNFLIVKGLGSSKKDQIIAIYSINGTVVYKQKHTNSGSDISIDVSSLPKGMYILQVYGKASQSIEFVK